MLFVFGAVLGLLGGFVWLIDVQDVAAMVSGLIVIALMGGLLSIRFGGRFWEWAARLGAWIWP